MKIKAVVQDFNDCISVLIREGDMIVKPLELTLLNSPNMYIDPTFSMTKTEAQGLMDDLWQCGLRPSEGSGSAGALAATERHLKDMQKLVFDKGT